MHFLPDLKEVADDCVDAVSDLLEDNDSLEEFAKLPEREIIQWRYAHADCDFFAAALCDITGWEIVSISSRSKGPLHRLNRTPDGNFIDAYGFVDLDALKKRYRCRSLFISSNAALLSDPEPFDIVCAVNAMMHLPGEPFQSEEFRIQALACRSRYEAEIE